ncbi:hypothetical protein V8C43DRAFT_196876 [Trichoderma afarasin]
MTCAGPNTDSVYLSTKREFSWMPSRVHTYEHSYRLYRYQACTRTLSINSNCPSIRSISLMALITARSTRLVPRISTSRAADYIRPSSPACRLTDHLTQQQSKAQAPLCSFFPPTPLSGSVFCLSPHSLVAFFPFFCFWSLVTTASNAHTPSHSFFSFPFSSFGPVAFQSSPPFGPPNVERLRRPHHTGKQTLNRVCRETLARSPASTRSSTSQPSPGQDRPGQTQNTPAALLLHGVPVRGRSIELL